MSLCLGIFDGNCTNIPHTLVVVVDQVSDLLASPESSPPWMHKCRVVALVRGDPVVPVVVVTDGNKPRHTEMGYKVGPRLHELAPRGQRKPVGGIHAT